VSNTPVLPPPQSCVILGVEIFDFEKMAFLKIFDTYVVVVVIFSKYFVIFRPKMKPLVYDTTG
jgi:hypothetical protein